MPPTVRRMIGQPAFGLIRLTPPGDRDDEPLAWVHSSDIADPTPFLSDGQMLLTTGTQFAHSDARGYDDYVARLLTAGVRALGFGTEVIRSGTPPELVRACEARGLPLVEVPYRTPFLAIIRWAAQLLAQEARERDTWALQAQRAISLAALGDGGLGAAVRVAAGELGAWILLLDGDGHVTAEHPRGGRGRAALLLEAQRLLDRGQRASSTLVETPSDEPAAPGAAPSGAEAAAEPRARSVLQTLGRSGRLRGVLVASGMPEWDAAARGVVTGLAALAELALEQSAEARLAGARGRARVLDLLLEGRTEAAEGAAAAVGLELPRPPLLVARLADGDTPPAELDPWQAGRDRARRALGGDRTVVLEARDRAWLDQALARASVAAGVSEATGLDDVAAAAARASRLRERAPAGATGLVDGSAVSAGGLLGLLAADELADAARERLGPVLDAPDGPDLLRCARVWLAHNGQWDPAARELGMHRHSLRARIVRLERATGLELDGFPDRAQLWALLASLSEG